MTAIYRYAAWSESAPWTIVAGERSIVCLPEPGDPVLVPTLWALVKRNAGFDEILATLPTEANGQLSQFIVVGNIAPEPYGAALSVVVRGPVRVDVMADGAPRRITPAEGEAWTRVDLVNVTNLAIGERTAIQDASLPLAAGVVRAARLDAAFGVSAFEGQAFEGQIGDMQDFNPPLDEHTVRSVGPSDMLPATNRPAASDVGTHDGQTVRRPDVPAPRATGAIEFPFVPPGKQTVMHGYRLSGGQAFALDLPHRFGRNPSTSTPDEVRLVTVLSATKTVSATHLEIRQIVDTVVVSDLRSTNGSSVILPRGQWRRLASGESVIVTAGTFIDIGDGNVIEIMPPIPLA